MWKIRSCPSLKKWSCDPFSSKASFSSPPSLLFYVKTLNNLVNHSLTQKLTTVILQLVEETAYYSSISLRYLSFYSSLQVQWYSRRNNIENRQMKIFRECTGYTRIGNNNKYTYITLSILGQMISTMSHQYITRNVLRSQHFPQNTFLPYITTQITQRLQSVKKALKCICI